jgi:hypothetical protein
LKNLTLVSSYTNDSHSPLLDVTHDTKYETRKSVERHREKRKEESDRLGEQKKSKSETEKSNENGCG